MTPIDFQGSRSKVKPIFLMLGKGDISVLQTSMFLLQHQHGKAVQTVTLFNLYILEAPNSLK